VSLNGTFLLIVDLSSPYLSGLETGTVRSLFKDLFLNTAVRLENQVLLTPVTSQDKVE